jgi:hypothetical protein
MNPNLKKFLPLILLVVGIIVVGGVFFMMKGKKADVADDTGDETAMIDVALDKRPIVGLTPDNVGHYLKMHIEKIQIPNAKTMDYELVYQVPDQPAQGVPGSIDISDKTSFDADLLLGSESSGKFRYDEGVETGMITLRFRNDKGKLLTKFQADFHMQKDAKTLTSADGKLTFELDKAPKGYFVTMLSVGVPAATTGEPKAGPYVIHSSLGDELSGKASIEGANVSHFEGGAWKELSDGSVKNLGYFLGM